MDTLVAPFRGWRYNPRVVGGPARVLAPPYDVINLAQQAELCLRSPHNIVRLDLGEPSGPRPGQPDRYRQAAELLARWRQEQALVRDPQPCFYLYEEQYRDPLGQEQTQRGIIGAVRLHDYPEGVILPHEGTLRGPKQDRLELMRACRCAFSQIFALYSDPERRVEGITTPVREQPPFFDFVDGAGVRQRMWVISDPPMVTAVQTALDRRQIVIADGHHRYETALAYREERRQEPGHGPDSPAERVGMFLANAEAGGLTILAAHRMLAQLPPGTWDRLATCPARPFHLANLVLPGGSDAEVARLLMETLARWKPRGAAFIAYGPERRAYLLIVPHDEPLPAGFGEGHCETWKRLEVSLLHHLLLPQVLGLEGAYTESGENITFNRDAEEAISLVEAGKQSMALLLNPAGVKEVYAIAEAGDRMPQKGTYFYPKLLAGTVLHDLDTA